MARPSSHPLTLTSFNQLVNVEPFVTDNSLRDIAPGQTIVGGIVYGENVRFYSTDRLILSLATKDLRIVMDNDDFKLHVVRTGPLVVQNKTGAIDTAQGEVIRLTFVSRKKR